MRKRFWAGSSRSSPIKSGDRYVCIINNVDPGATICRTSSHDRGLALREALQLARTSLAATVIHDVPPKSANACLARIVYSDDGQPVIYTVDEFISLPSKVMMLHILSGNIGYFDADGQAVPAGEAMTFMHKAAARPAATALAA